MLKKNKKHKPPELSRNKTVGPGEIQRFVALAEKINTWSFCFHQEQPVTSNKTCVCVCVWRVSVITAAADEDNTLTSDPEDSRYSGRCQHSVIS